MIELLMTFLVFGTAGGLFDSFSGSDSSEETTASDEESTPDDMGDLVTGEPETEGDSEPTEDTDPDPETDTETETEPDTETEPGDTEDPDTSEEPDTADEADNILNGDNMDNTFIASSGSDSLSGNAGEDTLVGTVDANDDGFTDPTDSDIGADTLLGGADNDLLFLGNGDLGDGGEGEDTLIAGTWVDPATPALVENFDTTEDTLIIQYPDDGSVTDISVTVQVDGEDAVVSFGGQTVIRVLGAAETLTSDMISLVPETLT